MKVERDTNKRWLLTRTEAVHYLRSFEGLAPLRGRFFAILKEWEREDLTTNRHGLYAGGRREVAFAVSVERQVGRTPIRRIYTSLIHYYDQFSFNFYAERHRPFGLSRRETMVWDFRGLDMRAKVLMPPAPCWICGASTTLPELNWNIHEPKPYRCADCASAADIFAEAHLLTYEERTTTLLPQIAEAVLAAHVMAARMPKRFRTVQFAMRKSIDLHRRRGGR